MSVVGTVESLWRYPVKSMAGERLDKAYLGFSGVYGDRLFSFASTASSEAFPYLTAREQPQMLLYRPRFRDPTAAALPPNLSAAQDVGPGLTPVHGNAEQLRLEVQTPTGAVLAIDDSDLAELLGEGIAQEHVLSLVRSERAQTDCRPIAAISLQTVKGLGDAIGAALDKRRFRANIYLDMGDESGFSEDQYVGCSVRIGHKATVTFLERDPRCKMITLDPDTGDSSPEVLREVAQAHDGKAGVYAAVTVEGTVQPGDEVRVL